MTRRTTPLDTATTVTDVARAAGVSPSTAARALGGYGAVSAASRERVAAAASRIGYRRNSLASSMVTGRTHTIGFVGADIGNSFFARALRGISDVARGAGLGVIIANSDEDSELERVAVRVLDEKRVDGFVIAPVTEGSADHIFAVAARGTPVVFLDRAVRGIAADAVLIDNVGAARAGIEHLCRLGHRRIALITTGLPEGDPVTALERVALDPHPADTVVARSIGYLSALRAAGLPVERDLIVDVPYDREAAAAAAATVLATTPPPTAIFTVDNLLTLGAYEGVQRSGLPFPGAVSLLGFDDLEWTTIVRPTLSVVAQPAYDLGAAAARRLVERLAGDDAPPQTLLLNAALVERDSTRPPARA